MDLLTTSTLLAAFICFTSICKAQSLRLPISKNTCDSCCSIKVVTYQTLVSYNTSNQGIIFRGAHIPSHLKFIKGEYVLVLGKNLSTFQPRLIFTCQDITVKRSFNNRKYAKRVGIWFKEYPWGSIRKALLYENGVAVEEVIFRPNGHLIRYQTSYKDHSRLLYFDKDGTVFPNTNNFEPVTFREQMRKANTKRRDFKKSSLKPVHN